MTLDLLKGRRLQGDVVNMAAAGAANAQVIFQASNYANQIGTRSFILKRVKIRSNGAPTTVVHIGTGVGAGFADVIPGLDSIADMNDDYVEYDLPEAEVFDDLTAYPDAVGAGTLDIQVEVEERG